MSRLSIGLNWRQIGLNWRQIGDRWAAGRPWRAAVRIRRRTVIDYVYIYYAYIHLLFFIHTHTHTHTHTRVYNICFLKVFRYNSFHFISHYAHIHIFFISLVIIYILKNDRRALVDRICRLHWRLDVNHTYKPHI